MRVWWLSFCDPALPSGKQFLGVSIVSGGTIIEATKNAHLMQCNPGGEVSGAVIPNDTVPFIADHWLYRLLTKAECDELDDEIKNLCDAAHTRAQEHKKALG